MPSATSRATWPLLLVASHACTPEPREPRSGTPAAAPSQAAPKVAASVPESPGERPLAPRPLADGCTTDVDPQGPALSLLARLSDSCISGMSPRSEPLSLTLDAGASADVPFEVSEPAKCLRVAAAGGPTIDDLELQVLDDSGEVLARDALDGRLALVNSRGPWCAAHAGAYRIVVRASKGGGLAALQIWQAD